MSNDVANQRERNARNARVQARYDELMREGKHGHYEALFRVVREEVEDAVSRKRIDAALARINGR